MKLVIQIPCLNEEATLPSTLADLPRTLPGVDTVEWLVIDDGSTDGTAEVARAHGADRVIRFNGRRGLAEAFSRGLQEALAMQADIIVNTDADNQYVAADIARLIAPILERRADMVVGARPIADHPEFSPLKKVLQRVGSGVVRRLSRQEVPDATSGFRAYNREAALRLTVLSRFTYTLETVIQAADKSLSIESVSIRVNPKTRESRLFRGMGNYVRRSLATMGRMFVLYQPLRLFLGISGLFLLAALVLLGRWLWFYFTMHPLPTGHVQSLIVAGVLLVISVLFAALGILSDLIAMNRRLIEEVVSNTRALRSDARRDDPGERT